MGDYSNRRSPTAHQEGNDRVLELAFNNGIQILLCSLLAGIEMVSRHPPSAEEARQAEMDHDVVHRLHEAFADAKLAIAGTNADIHDIQRATLGAMAANVAGICDALPRMVLFACRIIDSESGYGTCKLAVDLDA